MKAYSWSLMVLCTFALASVTSAQVICGEPQTRNLIAGQNINAGVVIIGNDDNHLYVTFVTDNGWTITETHVAVGATLSDIPQNRPGNPMIGHFAYKGTHDNVTTVVYAIPLSELGPDGCGAIAAHAVVQKKNGKRTQEETAWGQGARFPGRNWAMFMTYCEEDCEEEEPPREDT